MPGLQGAAESTQSQGLVLNRIPPCTSGEGRGIGAESFQPD